MKKIFADVEDRKWRRLGFFLFFGVGSNSNLVEGYLGLESLDFRGYLVIVLGSALGS